MHRISLKARIALAVALGATSALAACGADPDQPATESDVADLGTDLGADAAPDGVDEPDAAEVGDVGPPPGPTELVYPVGAPTVPRLTARQFENAIRDLFGSEIVLPRNIEPDLEQAGLRQIGAAAATISPRGVERYEGAAYEIADQYVNEAFRSSFACSPGGSRSDECARPVLTELASRAWRRPLTDSEVDVLVEIAGQAGEVLDDFYEGLEFGIAAIVQSPNFLFRVELGEPDPEVEGARRYTAWDTASRLSFLLWNSIPDDALRAAAADGSLLTDEGLAAQVDRMLADDRARAGLGAFFDELYQLYELEHLTKDPTIFPQMSAELGPAARQETMMGIEYVVFDLDADVRDLLTTRRTFLDRRLAALYDVRAPAREGFAETTLPADELRRGLLGQAAILALNAHSTSTSATIRGKFVREVMLCGVIPPPPSGVDTSIPEPTEVARTLRERVAVHLEDEFCAGCHGLMDPLGLALENFDGIGVYRELDNGVPVDASGELDGVEFDGFDDFVDLMAADPRYTACFVQKLNRYANSAVETPAQRNALSPLHDLFESEGFRFRALVRDYVMSPAFRRVGEVQ